MKVWIALKDYGYSSDSDLDIVGVFADAEKAKQALEEGEPLKWLQDGDAGWSADPRNVQSLLYQYYVWAYEVQ